jgi:hypothetical protein
MHTRNPGGRKFSRRRRVGHRALLSGGFMVPDAVSVTLEIDAALEIAEGSHAQ